ncbi:hypothetical protein [Pandoraea sp. PE-S2R-1]|uniref:helix-turn-helix transcriptional regulator n=1 Tax=Pandoraea sp. PE-S2R-1 TaxID=1986994 RepID=UPI0011322ACA|nr:hypothetical protein [Pandoraea sp. PE-S2R-1]
MGIQGDLRACLRQLHQLPVSTLDYLPIWLETLRTLLSADAVAALWHDGDTRRSMAGNWFAPQSSVSACERFAASGGVAASGDDGWFPMSPGGLIRGHARRVRSSRRTLDAAGECSPTLTRSPEFDACLGDGDVLDICLMPVLRYRAGQMDGVDAVDAVDMAHPADFAQRMGPLRILVSRDKTLRRFSAYEVQMFEHAAAEFAIAPTRPVLPWPEAGKAVFPVSAFGRDAGDDPVDPLCRDICGTLVWHHGQPEWADSAALGLMQRVWRGASGDVWPDACLVVRECHALAAELTSLPEAAAPSMSPEFLVPPASASASASAARHASRRVALPGGTLHLQATRLRSMNGRPTERVRIALHLAVPPAIRLLHRLWATPLTPVQREIAMRLLSGQSRAQAREACGIGVQTLKTHLSAMRARLDPVRDATLLRGLGGPGCGVSNASVRSDKTAARLE